MPFIPAPAVEADSPAPHVIERSVVVVGAGPVGLWVASELALQGVQVTILEKRTHRSSNSRALGIHPRTLEILAMRGLTRTFLPAGRPVSQWHFGMLGSPLRFDDLPTPFPYMLAIPQATTERLLEDHARGLGVEILVGAEVLDLVQ
ncbi:MAG: FAD-dependent oxidoreductase, partial [Janthinobacterium lividum]